MAAVLLYGMFFALLLCIAGVAIEQIAAWLNLPRRGIWVIALITSVAYPTVMVLRPRLPALPSPPAAIFAAPSGPIRAIEPPSPLVLRTPAARKSIPIHWGSITSLHSFDRVYRIVWIGLSGIVFGVFVLSWIRLQMASRQWRRETVKGHDVWITPALGPAVIGLFRPRILIPQWLLDAPASTCSLALAHEREHTRARDPILLLGGLLAVLAAPWNVPLWWQLRRLRFALEVDCDARVLRHGADLQAYGHLLLTVNQHSTVESFTAMAIAAPISRLERRVRIMTSAGFRPTKWVLGVAVSLAIACTAMAIDLQAPEFPGAELRKPPLHDWSPFLPKAEAAARAAYPGLFAGQLDGTVVLMVNLNRDGEVLDIHKREFPPGPLADDALQFDTEILADLYRGYGSANRKFIGWFGPQHANGLYLYYQVLKWAHDPSRSAARVRAAVAARYPEFFRAYPLKPPGQDPKVEILTVFMNDDGTINRSNLDDGNLDVGSSGYDEKHRFNRFLDLGLSPEQFGHRGWTANLRDSHELARFPNAPELDINYAWPRRPDDPPDSAFLSNAVFRPAIDGLMKESDAAPSDALFLERYFPNIWEHGTASTSDVVWLLVDRQGVVCDHGISRSGGTNGLDTKLMSRYPGTRIGLHTGSGPTTAHGSRVNLDYLGLMDDSPLTTCQAIAEVRRAD
jgi:hypothetical protein